MGKKRAYLSQRITDRVVVRRSIITPELKLDGDKASKVERTSIRYIALHLQKDRIEARMDEAKRQLLNDLGEKSENLVEITVEYPRLGKATSVISIWTNRYDWDITKLFIRLKPSHLDAFRDFVHEGTAFRVVISSTVATREADVRRFVERIEDLYPASSITPFEGSALEPLVNDEGLIDYCKTEQVSLKGTRTAVTNFGVYHTGKRSKMRGRRSSRIVSTEE